MALDGSTKRQIQRMIEDTVYSDLLDVSGLESRISDLESQLSHALAVAEAAQSAAESAEAQVSWLESRLP